MNEIIFLVNIVTEFVFILLLLRFGRAGMVDMMVVNILLISAFGAKLISIFGFTTNIGNVFYAAIFLTSNIVNEYYGRKTAFQCLWISFFAIVLFTILGESVVRYTGLEQTRHINSAITVLFEGIPRIALASMVAFVTALSANIFLYDLMHNRFKENGIWIRNIASSVVGQLVDSLLFFSIAFAGTNSYQVVLQIILVGFLLKIIVAILGTPLIYLAKKLLHPMDSCILKENNQPVKQVVN